MRSAITSFIALLLLVSVVGSASAGDWSGFRGSDGSGVSDDQHIPLQWSSEKNLHWKTELPGPGSSSPITVGDKVFVTCYSGYGTGKDGNNDQENLKRHLVCIDQNSGSIVWDKAMKAKLPEERYGGFLSQHGYASSTPVSDGEQVYVFFGKTGVLAFDLDGNLVWQRSVGSGSSPRGFGLGSSPTVYKDFVIVNASAESEAIIALNKKTGEEAWKSPASALYGSWCTPLIVESKQGKQELVINAPYEVWGLNPDTGKLLWYAEAIPDGNICPSLVAKDGIVYALGGRGGRVAVAVRTGGKGDVTKTHVLWTTQLGSYVPSPVLHDGYLYWVTDRGTACCLNAETGEKAYQSRLSGGFYASATVINDKIYAVSRKNGTYVLASGEKFQQLAHNKLEGDTTDFNGSPAVSNGRLFLRSNQALYCIGKK